MTEKEAQNPSETHAQEHPLMCKMHASMPIEVTCEDCEEFICSDCVKESHKDHNWQTIQTAAANRRRGLKRSLTLIEENGIQRIDRKSKRASEVMKENEKRCETEVFRLQKHFDAIVEKLDIIRKRHEATLKDRFESKNAEINKIRSSMERKKNDIFQLVESIRKNASTMTEIDLVKTHRELTKLLSSEVADIVGDSLYFLRHEGGVIDDAIIASMMGTCFCAELEDPCMNMDYDKNTCFFFLKKRQ